MATNKTADIKGTKPLVERVLRAFPKSRDNDGILVARCWALQIMDIKGVKEFRFETMSVKELFTLLAENKLVDPEDVSRARRILQKKDETLRGETYHTRHGAGEDVRQNINKEEENG